MTPPIQPPASSVMLHAPFGFSSAGTRPTSDFRMSVSRVDGRISIRNFVGSGASRRAQAFLGTSFSTIASRDITIRVTAFCPARGTEEFEAVGYADAECWASAFVVELGPTFSTVARKTSLISRIFGGFPVLLPFDQVPLQDSRFACHGTYSHDPAGGTRRTAVIFSIDTFADVTGAGLAGVELSVVPSFKVEQWAGLVDLPPDRGR